MRGQLATALYFVIVGCAGAAPQPVPAPTPPAASPPASKPAEPTPEVAVARRVVGQLVMEDVPEIPKALQERIRRYQNARSASVAGFAPGGGLLIRTRFGQTTQLHHVRVAMGARRQKTFFGEPIGAVATSPDPRRPGAVFTLDVGGSEFSQLFWLDVETGATQMLTDGTSRNIEPLFSPDGRFVIYSSTERNKKDFDLWRLDAQTKERTLWFEGAGLWLALDVAPAGDRVLALRYISATKTELTVIRPGQGVEYRFNAKADAAIAFGPAVFDATGRGVYYISDEGREFKALRYRDLSSGRDQLISDESLQADVVDVVANPARTRLALRSNDQGFSKVDVYEVGRRRFRSRRRIGRGVVSGLRFAPDGRRMAFTLTSPTTSGDVFVHDVTRNRTERWTASELGGIDVERLRRFDVVEYPTFDEVEPGRRRTIPAMIVRPAGEGPFPVVVIIHGGPEGQARPRFSTYNALIAGELGAAIIRPNVRGSTGYGRTYTLLDNGEKREDSVKDIGALLDWIKAQPDLDESRVAVLGASYGGYMVLASAVHYSDRLRAAVDVVGISNFVTFLERTKAYRRDLRRVEYGDERDPKMRAFLQSISPLNRAEAIRIPMLVIQGLNDPRVPATESEQIVRRLRERGQDVWYMLAKDEGHGFRKKENRDASLAAMLLFLQKYL